MNDYWRKIFGWSVSRQRVWDECRLEYYYRYIGRYEGPKDDPFKEKLKNLSNIKRSFFLKGQLIHDAIQGQVDHHYMGRPISEEAAKRYLKKQVEKARQKPKFHVIEAYNGIGLPDNFFDDLLEDGTDQLDTFFNILWPVYKDLEYLRHERFDSFMLDDLKVNVKIDLASRNQHGEVVVTDWKTGKEWDDPDESIQMSAYIVWASKRYKVPLNMVKGELVYLKTGKHVPATRTYEDLEGIYKMIKHGAREMLSVVGMSDFPSNPSDEKCKYCSFATVCPEGRKMLKEMMVV